MNIRQQKYWNSYLETIKDKPTNPTIIVGFAGNQEIADELLELYLSGKKTAGSALLKDYEVTGDPLPLIGNFWIILNSNNEPKCIVRTIRVESYQFDQVPKEVAIAEGEGDLSLEYWRKAHIDFFNPYLEEWGVIDLDKETLITEFFEVVYK